MGASEVSEILTHLTVARRVAASTQQPGAGGTAISLSFRAWSESALARKRGAWVTGVIDINA